MGMNIQRAVPELHSVDLTEKGRNPEGQIIRSNRRLFMQFQAYTQALDISVIIEAVKSIPQGAVLYADLNDPRGIGLLTFTEEPELLVTTWRQVLSQPPFSGLTPRPEFTMLGRTYAIGYEQNLERVLITRPVERVCDPALPWAIWYPLRRAGDFERLPAEEQRTILMEHGGIGRAYGNADLAYDIRLACFGLDQHDNDFVVGLLGHELYPLSSVIERMRKTRQTSEFLTNLGPFFIGRVLWQQSGPYLDNSIE